MGTSITVPEHLEVLGITDLRESLVQCIIHELFVALVSRAKSGSTFCVRCVHVSQVLAQLAVQVRVSLIVSEILLKA